MWREELEYSKRQLINEISITVAEVGAVKHYSHSVYDESQVRHLLELLDVESLGPKSPRVIGPQVHCLYLSPTLSPTKDLSQE